MSSLSDTYLFSSSLFLHLFPGLVLSLYAFSLSLPWSCFLLVCLLFSSLLSISLWHPPSLPLPSLFVIHIFSLHPYNPISSQLLFSSCIRFVLFSSILSLFLSLPSPLLSVIPFSLLVSFFTTSHLSSQPFPSYFHSLLFSLSAFHSLSPSCPPRPLLVIPFFLYSSVSLPHLFSVLNPSLRFSIVFSSPSPHLSHSSLSTSSPFGNTFLFLRVPIFTTSLLNSFFLFHSLLFSLFTLPPSSSSLFY